MSQLHWTNRNVENVTVIWHCSSKTVNFSSTNRYPEVGSGVLLRCFSGLIHRTRLSLFKKLKLFCEIPLIFELFLSVIEVDLMNQVDLIQLLNAGPDRKLVSVNCVIACCCQCPVLQQIIISVT